MFSHKRINFPTFVLLGGGHAVIYLHTNPTTKRNQQKISNWIKICIRDVFKTSLQMWNEKQATSASGPVLFTSCKMLCFISELMINTQFCLYEFVKIDSLQPFWELFKKHWFVFQEMNNITSATEYYKEVLKQDNTHVEAIACIGSHHFYTDQPEIALRFYRC